MTGDQVQLVSLYIQVALLFIQVPTLIALIVYVIKTWQMASATRKSAEVAETTLLEMRDARDQEVAPYVIAYFDVPIGKNLIYLVIKNVGRSMATDVKAVFDPPLQSEDFQPYHNQLFAERIPSLPPDYEIRTIFSDFVSYVNSGSPLRYTVNISYYGGISATQRSTQYVLDLSPYQGVVSVHESDALRDLVRRADKLITIQSSATTALQRITKTINERFDVTHHDASASEPPTKPVE